MRIKNIIIDTYKKKILMKPVIFYTPVNRVTFHPADKSRTK